MQLDQLCKRSLQLMESGGVAMPDLGRAATPLIQNVRQACELLEVKAGAGPLTYNVLTNLHAYLGLAEAVPRPYPFPEAASAQLTELRELAARVDAHFRSLLEAKEAQISSPDPDEVAHYAEPNRLLPASVAGKPRVVLLGDSITENWRINEYFPERDFVNRGISGQTTGEMLGRMKTDVLDLKPAAVVILGGTNDLARNVPLTTIEDHFSMMADLATAHAIRPVFASVLPVSDVHKGVDPRFEWTPARPPALINGLNQWLERFCMQRGFTYVNYFDALRNEGGMLTDDLSDDGLHPNGRGYRIMAPLLDEAVTPKRAPAPPPPVPQVKPNKGK
jgi:lysophospholipase L1-like esterase